MILARGLVLLLSWLLAPGWLLGPENQRKGLRPLSLVLSLLLILPEGKTELKGALLVTWQRHWGSGVMLKHGDGGGCVPSGAPEQPGSSGPSRSNQVTQIGAGDSGWSSRMI